MHTSISFNNQDVNTGFIIQKHSIISCFEYLLIKIRIGFEIKTGLHVFVGKLSVIYSYMFVTVAWLKDKTNWFSRNQDGEREGHVR